MEVTLQFNFQGNDSFTTASNFIELFNESPLDII
jgi:hypothetical protein